MDDGVAEHGRHFGTAEDFKATLGASKDNEDGLKRSIELQLLQRRLFAKMAVDQSVTETEIHQYYDKHLEEYVQPGQLSYRQVFVRRSPGRASPGGGVGRVNANPAKHKILMALEALQRGEAFEEVARKFSDDDLARTGDGKLIRVARGFLPRHLDETAFKLEPGQLSEVIEGPDGYTVLKVEQRMPDSVRSLSEATESIRAALLERKNVDARRALLRSLRSDAKIETFVAF